MNAEGRASNDWLHLKPYGYAPGGYMAMCRGCNLVVEWLDKRAIRCRKCAEGMFAQAMEARSGETEGLDPKGDSAVGTADAPNNKDAPKDLSRPRESGE